MRHEKLAVSHLFSTVAVIIALIIWQIYAIRVDNPYLMPHPDDVVKSLFELLGASKTYLIVFRTILRLIISMTISVFLGLVLGLISGMRYEVEALLKPFVISLRTLPVITIIIVVLIMYGNTVSLYVISFLLIFPIIYQAELDGIKNIDRTLLEVMSLDCDRCNTKAVSLVFLPLSMPFVRTGLIQSLGLG